MVSIIVGPILFGFLFGIVVGTRIHKNEKNSFKLTGGAVLAIIIGAFLMSWNLGQFPFYTDVPIATAFFSGICGILFGSLVFGNYANGDNN